MTEQTQPDNDTDQVRFADFDLNPDIVGSLADAGIHSPFPIQAMTLPIACAGNDVIGQAKTGTGKTMGFGLPLLDRVVGPEEPGYDELAEPGAPQALVVVPTRELATQVTDDLLRASTRRSLRILTIYGGKGYETQTKALERGADVIVGTPGRLIDLAGQKILRLEHVRCVVLDEADEMLDLGFLPDVEKILGMTPAGRQTMLFSATMPGPVISMARSYMSSPVHVQAGDPGDDQQTVKNVKQVIYRAHAMDKVELLAKVLQARGRGLTIVFSRTKRTAGNVAEELTNRGFAAAAIHGDLGQGAREQALRAFRSGKVDVLVATDVAARGIDVDDVTHVVNYQCPEDHKTYLHRTGRTGRAGRDGVAITLVDWDDLHRWRLIDRELGLQMPDPPETYSTSEHLYLDLDVPSDVTGRLPRSERTRAGLDAEHLDDSDDQGARRGRGGKGGSRSDSRSGKRDSSDNTRSTNHRGRRSRRDDTPESSNGKETTRDRPRRRRSRNSSQQEGGATTASASTTGDSGTKTDAPRRRRRRTVRKDDASE